MFNEINSYKKKKKRTENLFQNSVIVDHIQI